MHIYKLVKDANGHLGIQCRQESKLPISWNPHDVSQKYCAIHHSYFQSNVEFYEKPPLKALMARLQYYFSPLKAFHPVRDFDCPSCDSEFEDSIYEDPEPKKTHSSLPKKVNKLKAIKNPKERAVAWLNQ